MGRDERAISQRVAAHFATDPNRRDVWTALDLFLETDAYLNLGYSNWYQPHWLPSSQRRLVDVVGNAVVDALEGGSGSSRTPRLLDIGSGRGGPALQLAGSWGMDVLGLDLVGDNLDQARTNAIDAGLDDQVAFIRGTADQPPVSSRSVDACSAIDSLVYTPSTEMVLSEAHRVLDDECVLVLTDLVRRDADPVEQRQQAHPTEGDPVTMFADEWDMPALLAQGDLLDAVETTGFEVLTHADISDRSIRQFRPYSGLYLRLADGRGSRLIRGLCDRYDLDAELVTRQIRAAHLAIPSLAHVLVVGVKQSR